MENEIEKFLIPENFNVLTNDMIDILKHSTFDCIKELKKKYNFDVLIENKIRVDE